MTKEIRNESLKVLKRIRSEIGDFEFTGIGRGRFNEPWDANITFEDHDDGQVDVRFVISSDCVGIGKSGELMDSVYYLDAALRCDPKFATGYLLEYSRWSFDEDGAVCSDSTERLPRLIDHIKNPDFSQQKKPLIPIEEAERILAGDLQDLHCACFDGQSPNPGSLPEP